MSTIVVYLAKILVNEDKIIYILCIFFSQGIKGVPGLPGPPVSTILDCYKQ